MFCGFLVLFVLLSDFIDWENFEYIDILVQFLSFLYPSINAVLAKVSLIFVCRHYFVFIVSIVKLQRNYVITTEILGVVYV